MIGDVLSFVALFLVGCVFGYGFHHVLNGDLEGKCRAGEYTMEMKNVVISCDENEGVTIRKR